MLYFKAEREDIPRVTSAGLQVLASTSAGLLPATVWLTTYPTILYPKTY